jgi:A/G-specific adenine glycosylase
MHREVLAWFDENKRDLPWRTSSAWGVMISEYMLQQTPVNRVLPIWSEWITRWPTPQDLASAKKSDLLKAWGRLGYPRRAIRLHEAATIIARDHNNKVPTTLNELRKLPGVGEYTAAAIMAFAHKKHSLVLDVNIPATSHHQQRETITHRTHPKGKPTHLGRSHDGTRRTYLYRHQTTL